MSSCCTKHPSSSDTNDWFSGVGLPATALGEDGDLYLNIDPNGTGDIYKKIGGVWVFQMSLKGTTGNTGNTGADGVAGINGASILYNNLTAVTVIGHSTSVIRSYTMPVTDLGSNGDKIKLRATFSGNSSYVGTIYFTIAGNQVGFPIVLPVPYQGVYYIAELSINRLSSSYVILDFIAWESSEANGGYSNTLIRNTETLALDLSGTTPTHIVGITTEQTAGTFTINQFLVEKYKI